MKKYYLLIIIILAAVCSKAQGNLQFNAAIFLTTSTTFTVPANKVWKIESCDGGVNHVCTLNGATISMWGQSAVGSAQGFYTTGNSCPIWLPAGTYTFGISDPSQQGAYLSAIEFNIVP